MADRMTADEIQRAFPDEWVVATDFAAGERTISRDGVVLFHSPSRSAAIGALGAAREPAALWYVAPPLPRDGAAFAWAK